MKVKLHPLFLIFVLIITILGGLMQLLATLIAVILHELAHARVAESRNYIIKEICLMPYGAVLNINNCISKSDAFAVLTAGIAANLAFVISLVALWWLIPSIYAFTYIFVKANLTIALINLIPCDPLDGGKLMKNYVKNKNLANIISKVSGIFTIVLLLSLFIYSIFHQINLSYLIFSLFLGGYLFFPKINHFDFFNKSKDLLEVKEIVAHEKTPLYKLIKKAEKSNYTKFRVVDSKNAILGYIEEDMLLSLGAKHDAITPIGELIR